MELRGLVLLVIGSHLSAQGVITPIGADPDVGVTVISSDAFGGTIQRIDQIELQPLQSATPDGVYRVCCTVSIVGQPDTKVLTGLLDMRVAPPVWTPTLEVEQLHTANGIMPTLIQDDFQLSMSPDGLVVTWDNYRGNGPGLGFTYVCQRANTTLPFQRTSAVAISTLTGTWHDCCLGSQLLPLLPLIRYELFFSDVAFGARNVMRGELDPASGLVSNMSLVKTRAPGTTDAHSPGVLRDSSGTARALTYGQINAGGTTSDMLWTSNMVDTGATFLIGNNALSNTGWLSNGSTNGGAFHFGGPQPSPSIAEHTLLADTLPIPGLVRIAGWAPIRPATPVPGVFMSAVAIGFPLPPFTVPPVLEPIQLAPSIGITPLTFHNRFTGLAEWVFNVPPALYMPGLVAQMITIDLSTNSVHASNLATF